ncbi:MAG TPA: VOC family protein [Pseudonocardia sp.]|nr:VOC family protein [Pseudonocardia sp.]
MEHLPERRPVLALTARPVGSAGWRWSGNRLHPDFRPDGQDAEVARLLAHGAKRVDVGQGADVPWVVLADPEGNEFCVLGPRS